MRLTPVTAQPAVPAEIAARDSQPSATVAHISPLASTPDARTAGASMRATRLARLIGARVPGGIDFSGAAPTPRGPAIPLYRHPADANAVATRLAAPGILDVTA